MYIHTYIHTYVHTYIEAEEEARIFNIMRENSQTEIDKDVQLKDWLHPADMVRITELPEDEEIRIYTDGSKNDKGFGVGIAIFIKGKLEEQLKYKLTYSPLYVVI